MNIQLILNNKIDALFKHLNESTDDTIDEMAEDPAKTLRMINLGANATLQLPDQGSVLFPDGPFDTIEEAGNRGYKPDRLRKLYQTGVNVANNVIEAKNEHDLAMALINIDLFNHLKSLYKSQGLQDIKFIDYVKSLVQS